MYAVADTNVLVAEGTLTRSQAERIEALSRQNMVALAIHSILVFGIIAATGGLIFWLGTPVSVAVAGAAFLALGYGLLSRLGADFSMFGNAAALIGAGLLIGGTTFEMLHRYEEVAGPTLLILGAVLSAGLIFIRQRYARLAAFVFGAILVMAVAAHLVGLAAWLAFAEASGWPIVLAHGYGAVVAVALGWYLNVRLITALAIVPLAQMLDTGTFYDHAMYAFYSPESTLTIAQMVLVIGIALVVAARVAPRHARHALILALMACIVANLAALVGSLWGDVVGESLVVGYRRGPDQTWDEFEALQEAFRAQTITISANLYTVLWAITLGALVIWTALSNRRGLFNVCVTFAGLHAYTQLFESFGDAPLAYVIGGLCAIPLAWGVWKANAFLMARAGAV